MENGTVFGVKKSPVSFFLGGDYDAVISLANVKQCEVYVGPMLRHLVGFMGLHGGFLMGKMVNDTQRNDCIIRILMMRSFPWPMLSNVRSMLGPC